MGHVIVVVVNIPSLLPAALHILDSRLFSPRLNTRAARSSEHS